LLRDPSKESPEDIPAKADSKVQVPMKDEFTLIRALGSGRFWVFGMILFCSGFAQSVILVHIVPHATDIGISPIAAAVILSVFNVSCVFGNFIIGRTHDVTGGRWAMVFSFVLITSAMVLLLFSGTLWGFYIVAAMGGMGFSGTATLRSPMVAELFGLRSHGVITGAIMLIYTAGSALGPLVAGYVFDLFDQYQAAFVISMAVGAAGVALAFWLKFKIGEKNTNTANATNTTNI
jgi:MFS family permease